MARSVRRAMLVAATLAFLQIGSVIAAHDQTANKESFQPPATISVSEIGFPIAVVANGTTVLDVLLSQTGEVEDISVRRELVPVTGEALRAVKAWKFSPAKLDGKPMISRMAVAVNFHPQSTFAAPVSLPPLKRWTEPKRVYSRYRPAEVLSATFPTYPAGGSGYGTVVIEATLSESGKVLGTKVLRDAVPLTAEAAIRAIAEWKFRPATLDGKPVGSKIALAFVFTTPAPPNLPN